MIKEVAQQHSWNERTWSSRRKRSIGLQRNGYKHPPPRVTTVTFQTWNTILKPQSNSRCCPKDQTAPDFQQRCCNPASAFGVSLRRPLIISRAPSAYSLDSTVTAFTRGAVASIPGSGLGKQNVCWLFPTPTIAHLFRPFVLCCSVTGSEPLTLCVSLESPPLLPSSGEMHVPASSQWRPSDI